MPMPCPTAVPPPEAYSRVTNPERFRPLHALMVELIGRLEATFDVERLERYGLDDDLEKVDLVRPSVKLLPRDISAASIAVSFTAFPGLLVRVGRWRIDAFPSCGYDACDETMDGESASLTQRADAVRAGGSAKRSRDPRLEMRGRNQSSPRRVDASQVELASTVPMLDMGDGDLSTCHPTFHQSRRSVQRDCVVGEPAGMAVLAQFGRLLSLGQGGLYAIVGSSNGVSLCSTGRTRPRQATYDLRCLKRKGLIEEAARHRRYQLTAVGRRVAVLFTKTATG